jgi:hypothetical protein
MIKWSISFITHGRSARIITNQPAEDVPALAGDGSERAPSG